MLLLASDTKEAQLPFLLLAVDETGGKTNIQLNPNAGVGSDITGAGHATGTATKGSEDSIRAARKDDEGAEAFLDVEVVGFGNGEISQETPSSNRDKRERKKP